MDCSSRANQTLVWSTVFGVPVSAWLHSLRDSNTIGVKQLRLGPGGMNKEMATLVAPLMHMFSQYSNDNTAKCKKWTEFYGDCSFLSARFRQSSTALIMRGVLPPQNCNFLAVHLGSCPAVVLQGVARCSHCKLLAANNIYRTEPYIHW
jgi:hypothetical protein